MRDNSFEELYRRLNPEQKEAVDTIDGPVMVAAGPGTGKTQILTLRIANILLQKKAKPEEILALTFTESGASAMRGRLLEILGIPAYYIPIHTFHAFCNDAIKDNPDEFAQFYQKDVVDDINRLQILEKVIEEGPYKALKPFGDPFMYAPSMLRAFSELKREGVGPEAFSEIVKEEENQLNSIEDLYYETGPHKGKMKGKYKDLERNVEKNKELQTAYGVYQARLLEAGYDYDDIILSVLERLENDGSFLQKLQEQYKYILVDEHQDTNSAQNRVLDLLCSHQASPNIFVVGDEKQSIYRFQGANIQNFLYFHTKFPEAKIITLKENYRSTQSILDAADSVIVNNSQKLSDVLPAAEQSLKSKSEAANELVSVHSFESKEPEHYFLAKEIESLIKGGVKPEDIAVLYRDNKDAFPIKEMLQKFEVPSRIESDEQILGNVDIQNLVLILKAVSNFGDEELLAKILHIDFLRVSPLDTYKLLDAARFTRRGGRASLYDLIRSKRRMREMGISKAVRLNKLYYDLSSWNEFSKNKSVPQTFEKIVMDSGFLAHILKKEDYIEGVTRARSLHQLARRLASSASDYKLSDFLENLEAIEARGIHLKSKKLGIQNSAVRLMTAHRAKGLEFDHVFITGAYEGHWGGRRVRELLKLPNLKVTGSDPVTLPGSDPAKYKNDDERRLFYVALTRARKRVYITYASKKEDEKDVLPSQFVEEIKSEYKKYNDEASYTKEYHDDPTSVFKESRDIRIKDDEFEFLRSLFDKHGLSSTALNNYIECPWKYFYINLLRIPGAKSKHQMYGTAIHAALKDLFDNLKVTGSDPVTLGDLTQSDYLLARFERALLREPISEHDFKESLEKGKETLAKYYENYKDSWHTDTVNEFSVTNVFLDGEVRLTGKIDKIELRGSDPQKEGQTLLSRAEVNVVDYKTGKRKTRNELEGKTKNATGNEKRQLVFYKLLLDNLKDSPYKMVSGEIDFVESEKRTDKLYKEKFEITDEDTRELEYKIQDVVTEIRGFSFWDMRCDNKNCEYCKLRDIMQLH